MPANRVITGLPELKLPGGPTVCARAVAALGDRVRAQVAFNTLVGDYAGPGARAREAKALLSCGKGDRLGVLLSDTAARLRHMPAAARNIHRGWIDRIREVEHARKARSIS